MLKYFFALFLYVFFNISVVQCAEYKGHFAADDTSYTYSVNIQTATQCEKISKSLFSHEAQRYFNKFADSIQFDDIDSCTQICDMKFSYLFYHGHARYLRILYPGDSITINLEKFEHNWSAVPKLKSAFIRYYFHTTESGCLVEYRQNIVVNKKMGSVYRRVAERQLRDFTRRLYDYIQRYGMQK